MTDDALALLKPVSSAISPLPFRSRIALLTALLAHEICTTPPATRRGVMQEVLDRFPAVLDATEAGMRQALAENARGGA